VRTGRKHAVVLWLISAWNVLSYANFARNLYEAWSGGEDRTTGYYAAHIVLIVVNLVIAVYLTLLGRRVWRRREAPEEAPG
jgi:membrane protein implicated in regulation of membrane protease activity